MKIKLLRKLYAIFLFLFIVLTPLQSIATLHHTLPSRLSEEDIVAFFTVFNILLFDLYIYCATFARII